MITYFDPKPDPAYGDRERYLYVAGYSDAFHGRPYLTSWDRWEGVPINPAYVAGWNYARGNAFAPPPAVRGEINPLSGL